MRAKRKVQTCAEDPAILLQVGNFKIAMVKTYKKHVTRFWRHAKRNLYQCKYKPAVNSSGRTSWSWQFHLTNWWWPSSHSQAHICYTRSTKEPGSQLHGYDAYPFFEPPVTLQSHRFYHQLRGGQTRSWHFTLHVWVQFYRFSLYTYRMIYTLYYMHALIYIYVYILYTFF